MSPLATTRVHLLCAGDYEWPRDKPVSPELKDLMSKIFVADPAARISIAQIQVPSDVICHLTFVDEIVIGEHLQSIP